jgi:hypothetical protein
VLRLRARVPAGVTAAVHVPLLLPSRRAAMYEVAGGGRLRLWPRGSAGPGGTEGWSGMSERWT